MNPTRDRYKTQLMLDLTAFIARSFYELNPQTEYLPNWHIEILAAELEKCRTGETKRLIINVPPRSLKSHCASIAFPAFLFGHNPAAQIICASYGQQLADKLAADCRSLMASPWYQDLFPRTRLASGRRALNDFTTTRQGGRLSTSVGGILTGRGADYIIIDDPLKPDEALSETQRNAVNQWYDGTLLSRLNDKRSGCIILIMQRLHQDDLVGHVQTVDNWRVLKFPAIAEENESHTVETPDGTRRFERKAGEALHPTRESLEVLGQLRNAIGEYNFAGQYQQNPAPLGGGIVKASWFKHYTPTDRPEAFDLVFQSWDTANKAGDLNDFSVCTTWGLKNKNLYLLHVLRRRMEYPALKRAIHELAAEFRPANVLIEDKASGTQLIQELIQEGVPWVTRYAPEGEKIMRLHSATNQIENGRVFLPEKAPWLDAYLLELTTFPNGKYDDQADSTSQALDWVRNHCGEPYAWLRILARRGMVEQGDLEDVKKIDEQYGPPPKETKPPRPSGPAVYTGDGPPRPSGPAIYSRHD